MATMDHIARATIRALLKDLADALGHTVTQRNWTLTVAEPDGRSPVRSKRGQR